MFEKYSKEIRELQKQPGEMAAVPAAVQELEVTSETTQAASASPSSDTVAESEPSAKPQADGSEGAMVQGDQEAAASHPAKSVFNRS